MVIKTLNRRWTLWAAMILLSLFCQSSTEAQTGDNTKQQQTADEIIGSFTYSKVLNTVMPKTVALSGEITMALTVRVEPSFEEEFQYTFLKRRNGEIEFVKKRSGVGNIYYKITGAEEEQGRLLTPVELAKLVHVLETRISISPAKFKEIVEDLDIAVQKHERRESVRLKAEQRRREAGEQVASTFRDGTRYVIWMAGEKKYDLSVQGQSYKSPAKDREDPLIAWVRKLVKEL